jgi:hypothetical protein
VKIAFEGCVYRDEFERTWRNQTVKASQRAQEQWKTRSTKQNDDMDIGRLVPWAAEIDRSSPSRLLGLEGAVMDRFWHDWVVYDPQGIGGFSILGYLPPLYKKAPEGGVLRETIAALAWANYSQRFHDDEADDKATQCCSTALKLLRETVNASPNEPSDDVIASISLLGMYEVGVPLHRKLVSSLMLIR